VENKENMKEFRLLETRITKERSDNKKNCKTREKKDNIKNRK
jgi:hypothetical protein